MFHNTEHRFHVGLDNRAKNAHQLTRRKEKCLIKFKFPKGVQSVLSLMGKVRKLFDVSVGRYTKLALQRRIIFEAAKTVWDETAGMLVI